MATAEQKIEDSGKSLWEHIDDLKRVIIIMAVTVAIFAIVAFCFKSALFELLLAPRNSDFIFYRMLSKLATATGIEGIAAKPFDIKLINIELTAQFMIHLTVSFWVGVLCAAPILIFELFRYISPALYANERHAILKVLPASIILFYVGVALNYFLVFPVSFHFLATYTVSPDIENTISLQSYFGTFTVLSLMMGVAFEVPIICLLLGKLGLISRHTLTHYRRHAIVAILIVAAIVTPTTDIFTLLIVSLPIYLLFELGVHLIPKNSVALADKIRERFNGEIDEAHEKIDEKIDEKRDKIDEIHEKINEVRDKIKDCRDKIEEEIHEKIEENQDKIDEIHEKIDEARDKIKDARKKRDEQPHKKK